MVCFCMLLYIGKQAGRYNLTVALAVHLMHRLTSIDPMLFRFYIHVQPYPPKQVMGCFYILYIYEN